MVRCAMSGTRGSINDPISLSEALLLNSHILPGRTIYLREGVHKLAENITTAIGGEADNPITLQPYPGEHAVIELDGAWLRPGAWLRFVNLEIRGAHTTRISQNAGSNPSDLPPCELRTYAAHVEFAGCYIHDLLTLFGESTAGGFVMRDCLVANVGWYSTFDSFGHGHALYLQNSTADLVTIDTCIFMPCYGQGLQFYGSNVNLCHLRCKNLIQHGRNLVVGGEVASIVDDIEIENLVMCGYGLTAQENLGWASGTKGSIKLTNNLYAGVTARILANDWQSVDESGTVVNPNETTVRVYSCSTAPKLAHIAVVNPLQLEVVEVDVSGLAMQQGASYRLRNAYDPLVDYMDFEYDGSGTLTMDMLNRGVAIPIGASEAQVAPDVRFGAWMLEAI